MNRFFVGLSIFVLVLIAICVAVGWVTFHKSPEKATIEIQTHQMEQAGEKVVEGSRKLVEEAADSVKRAVHEERHESTVREDRSVTSNPAPPTTPD